MKKTTLAVILCAIMIVSVFTACGNTTPTAKVDVNKLTANPAIVYSQGVVGGAISQAYDTLDMVVSANVMTTTVPEKVEVTYTVDGVAKTATMGYDEASSDKDNNGMYRLVYTYAIPAKELTGKTSVTYKVTAGDMVGAEYTTSLVVAPSYCPLSITELLVNHEFQFIECFNSSASTVKVSDYQLMYGKASDKELKVMSASGNDTVAPGEYVVFCIKTATANYDAAQFTEKLKAMNPDFNAKVIVLDSDANGFTLGKSGSLQVLVAKKGETVLANALYTCRYYPSSGEAKAGKTVNFNFDVANPAYAVRTDKAIDPTPGKLNENQTIPTFADYIAPVVALNIAATENVPVDNGYEVVALVADKNVKSVKLGYVLDKDEAVYLDMESAGNNVYKAKIEGKIKYVETAKVWVEAADALSTVVSDAYTLKVSDKTGPTVTKHTPDNTFFYEDVYTPVITVTYEDISGIDATKTKLYVGDKDITAGCKIDETALVYEGKDVFKAGEYEVKVVLADKLGNQSETTWKIAFGDDSKLNIYFGEVHAHTTTSDGAGTMDEAYQFARDVAKFDFFCVTDHGDWFFDNDDYINKLVNIAKKYYVAGEYCAMYGFEMTWRARASSYWGHANAINVDWVYNKLNFTYNLADFARDLLKSKTIAIGQLNHPGDIWGDFSDYANVTEELDAAIQLIETRSMAQVKEYYRALTQGWHIAPVFNEDNHKAEWGMVQTYCTGVVSPALTNDNIAESMKKMRVYCTGDPTLEIEYKVNGEWLGSTLKNPNELKFYIHAKSAGTRIGTISIVAEDDIVVASKTFSSTEATWEITLKPEYDYYSLDFNMGMGKYSGVYAVTAPVWVEMDESLDVDLDYVSTMDKANPLMLTGTVTNNTKKTLQNVNVDIYRTDNDANAVKKEITLGETTKFGTVSIGTMAPGETKTFTYNCKNLAGYIVYQAVVTESTGLYADSKYIDVSHLQITEIVPTSDVEGDLQSPYGYVELYNPTCEDVKLASFLIRFRDTTGDADNTMTQPKLYGTIKAHSSIILWINPHNKPIADFNRYWGTTFTEDQIVSVKGYYPSATRSTQIEITTVSGAFITVGRYNWAERTMECEKPNTSVKYKYALDGSVYVTHVSTDLKATPGVIEEGLVPKIVK